MKVDGVKQALSYYRRHGYIAGKVEGFVTTKRPIKADLFGILDVVAVGYGQTIGVQVCTLDDRDIAKHRKKMREAIQPTERDGLIDNKPTVDWLKVNGWIIHLFKSGWSKKENRILDLIEEM